jgi:hypothetical protein
MEVERLIVYYDKNFQEYQGKFSIFIELEILQNIFKPDVEDNDMYRPYRIKRTLASKIYEFINCEFDFDKYDYFIECYKLNPKEY